MLFVTIFLASIIGRCFLANTEHVPDFFELRLNKTETDIMELKEIMGRLNTSENVICKGTNHENGTKTEIEIETNESFSDESKENERMEKKMKHIFDHVEKNSQALMDEFGKTLTVLRKQHQDINKKITSNNVTIGRVMEKLSMRDKSNNDKDGKPKRSDFGIGKFEDKLSVLDDTVSDIRKELKNYDEKFFQLEKRLTRLDMKSFDIGESIERNYISVGNIDFRLVEMDRSHTDFVEDFITFKKEIKKKIDDLVKKIKLTPSSQRITTKACPKRWIQHGNICYLYNINTGKDWASAVSTCNSLGAKLAEPDNREEMDFLRGFVHGWIGASDKDNEGVFIWESSKKTVEYLPWWPGMPDNNGGDQDCVSLWGSVINDEDCAKRYRFVCEKRLE